MPKLLLTFAKIRIFGEMLRKNEGETRSIRTSKSLDDHAFAVQKKEYLSFQNNIMSVTNIIDEEEVTIVQGVNGILLCRESWMNDSIEAWNAKHENEIPDTDN